MKKIIIVNSLRLLFVGFVFISLSCSNGGLSDKIIGKWRVENIDFVDTKNSEDLMSINNMINNGSVVLEVEYKKNKEVIQETVYDGKRYTISKGSYEIDEIENKIIRVEEYTLNENTLSLEKTDFNEELVVEIISISNDKLIVKGDFDGIKAITEFKKI